jgi:uncharacterized protein (TIGR02118 family)
MAKLIVLYRTPESAADFDAYYYGTHVPIAKKIPGLRRYEVSSGPVATPQGASEFHMVAQLEFDSLAALGTALGSPEGRAAAGDLGKFATGGVELLVMDTREI